MTTIEIVAPEGIGEITPDSDIPAEILAALGPGFLRDGDIVVVTSKIYSKHQGRTTDDYAQALADETVEIVAARPGVRIVRNRLGIVQAAAGIDRSNTDSILLLPTDPDAAARELRNALQSATDTRLGVIISDTAGRAWRAGQTDHAIGVAGLRAIDDHAGRVDAYGNELAVTAIAVADEIAAAADLAKTKLGGRPVAVVRGRADLLTDDGASASDLLRPAATDMFARGAREAVLAACLTAIGHASAYSDVVTLPPAEARHWILQHAGYTQDTVLRAILADPVSGASDAMVLPTSSPAGG